MLLFQASCSFFSPSPTIDRDSQMTSSLHCSPAVPFREAPAYSKRRQSPSSGTDGGNSQSVASLSAPRVLLRSNSDNNLTVSQYQQHGSPSHWGPHLQQHPNRAPQQGHSQPGSSALHRSLSPQLLQQMPSGSPNGNVVVRTMGRGSRSRSPSLSRLGEEARRAVPSQRQPRCVSSTQQSHLLDVSLVMGLFEYLFTSLIDVDCAGIDTLIRQVYWYVWMICGMLRSLHVELHWIPLRSVSGIITRKLTVQFLKVVSKRELAVFSSPSSQKWPSIMSCNCEHVLLW